MILKTKKSTAAEKRALVAAKQNADGYHRGECHLVEILQEKRSMNEVADIGAVEAVSDEPLFDRSDATCLVERYNNSTACLFSSLVPTIGSQRAIIITDFHVRAYTWCPCVLFCKNWVSPHWDMPKIFVKNQIDVTLGCQHKIVCPKGHTIKRWILLCPQRILL